MTTKKRAALANKAAQAKDRYSAIRITSVKKSAGPRLTIGVGLSSARPKIRLVLKSQLRVYVPSDAEKKLIGDEPLTVREAQKRVLAYVHDKNLITNTRSGRRVKIDDNLKVIIGRSKKHGKGRDEGGSEGDNPGPSISVRAFKRLLAKYWS